MLNFALGHITLYIYIYITNLRVTMAKSLLKDVNRYSTCTSYLFIVVKVCAELDTLFGWADNRGMIHRFFRTILFRFWIQRFSFSQFTCPTHTQRYKCTYTHAQLYIYIYIYIYIYMYPTPSHKQFSFSKINCNSKVNDPCLSNYLSIAVGKIIGFISFPKVIGLCEKQTASSRV